MINKLLPVGHHFWLLVAGTFSLIVFGLVISWGYIHQWSHSVWQACQSGWQNLVDNGLLSWYLVIPALMFVILARGGWSIFHQVRATRQLARLFYPLQQSPPAHLLPLLQAQGLLAEDIVFLNLTAVHAFCLGFWRPRIWLTAGLVNLLSEEELAAVLAHETHHCRQRDPLRLLISRTLKSAFFFLPVVSDLVQTTEIQQEIAADQSAILQLGDDMPLLSALHKLLRQGGPGTTPAAAAYSPFSPTEARLHRLIYPSRKINNPRKQLSSWLISIGIALMLGSTLVVSSVPPAAPANLIISRNEIDACSVENNEQQHPGPNPVENIQPARPGPTLV